ncbi:helix-turn-helix domain-containing protein [Rhizobium sp. L1K21]|uniref:helix-turn-helix domain-containing protein n=1 Tax=Rhizobium sp. L1K21 TaxID=2954933 RepID=UPI002092DC5D|nr:helix-turn-helix transcriptional regulator [Rhizobium sp. L1K21]MCO6187451.1 helix-turn-helix domain-containing protein [Rhizobium sp. L1K21]
MLQKEKILQQADMHVGVRIKIARKLKHISQTKLAEHLGVSFQQVQKYENGKNRISASKLAAAADLLGVTPAFFFADGQAPAGLDGNIDDESAKLIELMSNEDALALNLYYAKIENPEVRRSVLNLVQDLAAAESQQNLHI